MAGVPQNNVFQLHFDAPDLNPENIKVVRKADVKHGDKQVTALCIYKFFPNPDDCLKQNVKARLSAAGDAVILTHFAQPSLLEDDPEAFVTYTIDGSDVDGITDLKFIEKVKAQSTTIESLKANRGWEK
ncbi:MAG: hypothetical protein AAFQ92_29960, partial [Bacteroidota bacterium]